MGAGYPTHPRMWTLATPRARLSGGGCGVSSAGLACGTPRTANELPSLEGLLCVVGLSLILDQPVPTLHSTDALSWSTEGCNLCINPMLKIRHIYSVSARTMLCRYKVDILTCETCYIHRKLANAVHVQKGDIECSLCDAFTFSCPLTSNRVLFIRVR